MYGQDSHEQEEQLKWIIRSYKNAMSSMLTYDSAKQEIKNGRLRERFIIFYYCNVCNGDALRVLFDCFYVVLILVCFLVILSLSMDLPYGTGRQRRLNIHRRIHFT